MMYSCFSFDENTEAGVVPGQEGRGDGHPHSWSSKKWPERAGRAGKGDGGRSGVEARDATPL